MAALNAAVLSLLPSGFAPNAVTLKHGDGSGQGNEAVD
jgi:hypothetical protein